MTAEIEILKIKNLNVLVIKNKNGRFFLPTGDGFIISIPNLAALLIALIKLGYLSPKVLEGVLSEVVE
jgi:hypothetical protein